VIAGALAGGAAAYIVLTPRGQALRRRLEPALEDYGRELNSLRATLTKVAGVASEGWKLLNDAIEHLDSEGRYPIRHQHAPF